MEIKAKLVEISETTQVTDSFKKREFIVEYAENPQYPQFLKFELIQENCSLLDDFKQGQEIEIYFNLKGRKWTDPKGVDKYFNTLQAWKLQAQEAGSEAPLPSSQDEPGWISAPGEESEDELPF